MYFQTTVLDGERNSYLFLHPLLSLVDPMPQVSADIDKTLSIYPEHPEFPEDSFE
jgi:hypothetical protein